MQQPDDVLGCADGVRQRDEVVGVSAAEGKLLDETLRVVASFEEEGDAFAERLVLDEARDELLPAVDDL